MSTIGTRSSTRVTRPASVGPSDSNPQPTSLQAVSNLRRLSEQPEDPQSSHAPDDDELVDKGKGREDPPDDDEPPPDNDSEHPSSDSENQGKKFFNKLIRSLDKPNTESRAKVREPEVYDGNDQAKLRTFFLQCMLNFRDRPKAFATGATRIQYAISYLSGPALQYFEPAILGEIVPEPIWLSDWDSFRTELETNFGPFDNAAQAEIELEKIVMKEHHRAARYFIEFARASTRTQWNDAALKHIAYRGLAKRIKDDLLHFPRYKSLAELRNFALEIDSRYWERKEYDTIATPSKTPNTNRSPPQTNQQPNNNGSNNQKNRGKNNKSSNNGNNNSTPQGKNPDLSSKLGKDGKLLPEERQRRIDQGLCLLCGSKGHMVKECPKSSSSSKPANTKARSAKANSDTKTENVSTSTSESKK